MVCVRLATVADAAGVLDVYAPYVEETPITFETSVPSEEVFAARMEAVIGDYPYLVVEDAGRIVGFAYAHRLGERDATAVREVLDAAEAAMNAEGADAERGPR